MCWMLSAPEGDGPSQPTSAIYAQDLGSRCLQCTGLTTASRGFLLAVVIRLRGSNLDMVGTGLLRRASQ